MNSEPALLFALETTRDLGGQVAAQLGQPLGRHEEREFGGGEQKVRPLEEVAGRDVYVINSLHGDERLSANDKLVRLLFFIGALKDAGAGCVTAVTPFIAYGRKDRRTKPRDPVNSRYIAALFEAVGTDRVVTLEVHNVSAFENSFRTCRTEHVPVAGIIANHLAAKLPSDDLAVVSPDAGGVKRAELLRLRDSGAADHHVLTAVMAQLDIEESWLERLEERDATDREGLLRGPQTDHAACAHLRRYRRTITPLTPQGCPDCEREGLVPVHLRLCLACGNVGCCDSSVGRHASRHYRETGHEVIRSFEPGEAWRWCYVDEVLG
jgi:hypothetical protein